MPGAAARSRGDRLVSGCRCGSSPSSSRLGSGSSAAIAAASGVVSPAASICSTSASTSSSEPARCRAQLCAQVREIALRGGARDLELGGFGADARRAPRRASRMTRSCASTCVRSRGRGLVGVAGPARSRSSARMSSSSVRTPRRSRSAALAPAARLSRSRGARTTRCSSSRAASSSRSTSAASAARARRGAAWRPSLRRRVR